MGEPVAFFMVVYRRSLGTRLFGWLLPRRASVLMVNRTRTASKPFVAKIGSVYTCTTRDVALDMGRLKGLYRLVKFKNLGQVKAYCLAQGLNPKKLVGLGR